MEDKYLILKYSEIKGANSIVQNFKWGYPECKKCKYFNELIDKCTPLTFEEFEELHNHEYKKMTKIIEANEANLPFKYGAYCLKCCSNLELLSGEKNVE